MDTMTSCFFLIFNYMWLMRRKCFIVKCYFVYMHADSPFHFVNVLMHLDSSFIKIQVNNFLFIDMYHRKFFKLYFYFIRHFMTSPKVIEYNLFIYSLINVLKQGIPSPYSFASKVSRGYLTKKKKFVKFIIFFLNQSKWDRMSLRRTTALQH